MADFNTEFLTLIITVIPYIIGLISGIIVTFIAYTLNARTSAKEKKEQKIAVHKLIKLEIDQNIMYLENFFNEITKESDKNGTQLGSRMGSLPLPPLNNGMYTKFALLLPSYFENSEFKDLYDFYRYIDDIKFVYSKTGSIVKDSNNIVMRSVGGSESHNAPPGIGMWIYGSKLEELWNEFEEIITKLLENGNPL